MQSTSFQIAQATFVFALIGFLLLTKSVFGQCSPVLTSTSQPVVCFNSNLQHESVRSVCIRSCDTTPLINYQVSINEACLASRFSICSQSVDRRLNAEPTGGVFLQEHAFFPSPVNSYRSQCECSFCCCPAPDIEVVVVSDVIVSCNNPIRNSPNLPNVNDKSLAQTQVRKPPLDCGNRIEFENACWRAKVWMNSKGKSKKFDPKSKQFDPKFDDLSGDELSAKGWKQILSDSSLDSSQKLFQKETKSWFLLKPHDTLTGDVAILIVWDNSEGVRRYVAKFRDVGKYGTTDIKVHADINSQDVRVIIQSEINEKPKTAN